ncbi:Spy0128 family protein [Muricoprocola aceti]|uniref:SpaA isopeptide-forming pilin-related protein n=1 Tax=Muricoprocola aceti TaxID=2981772 RepID=A0ABT2SLQ8_9FIRM|nr:FctA domain-containing protein [Muricoprocola aceti]MCU6725426.1 SpaA isopeptide-forming pilin-related protein [Muricoprocola aceti]
MSYSKNGTYYYKITETGTSEEYILDSTSYVVKVEVTSETAMEGSTRVTRYSSRASYYKGSGVEDCTEANKVESVEGITFNNTTIGEEEVPASESFTAVKKVDGETPSGNQTFTFKLEQIGDVPEGSKKLEEKATENHGETVDFGSISYSKNGTYYYKISETGTSEKYILDGTSYVVKVEVTSETALEGSTRVTRYSSRASYYKGSSVEDCTEANKVAGVAGITFNNTTIGESEVPTSERFTAVKKVDGETPSENQTFTFKLEQIGDVPEGSKKLEEKATENHGETVDFGSISYSKNGTYYYKISETGTSDKYILDGTSYVVKVEVTSETALEGSTRITRYSSRASYYKGSSVEDCTEANKVAGVGGIAFNNITYTATGELELEATKVLTGKELTSEEFSFELKNKEGTVLQTKKNDAFGNVKFDKIAYTLDDVGEHVYTVSEGIPEDTNGIMYDNNVYTVEVVVSDNGDGTLQIDKTIKDSDEEKRADITFTNTYYEKGSANLRATKDFSGTTWKDETFQFVLTAGKAEGSEAASPMPEGTVDGSKTVTVTKDSKTAEFGTIVYVNNGTYNYQIHEVNDEQAGITYDGIVWNVRVIVSNGQNGVKNVAIQYKKSTDETYTQWNDANDAFAVTFHNTYVEKGTARIQVAKEFNADEYPTGDDAFTFTLKAAQNEEGTTESPLPKQTTIKVTDANAVSFGDITFDTNGTYNYTVEENAGMLPNVIYDKTVYDVQIKVEDGGKADGVKKITVMSKKQADKEYAPLDGTVFTAAFSNTRYAVNVKKTDLTGVNEVKGATITVYKASDINEDGTVKENAEKITAFESNGGANDISEKLIRGEAYVLVETSAPEGYAFTNNIPFTLNEDGTVTVDKELQAEDGTILVKDALIGEQKVPLSATKTLTGAALTGDDFSFTLEEVKEDGTTELLQTKTNDAAGKVAFDDLTYDYKAEGKTFTYVVKETDTQKTGITYSKEAYTVKVVISKADTEGKMTAEVSYTDADGKAADAMNFTNTFAGSVSLVKVGPQQQKLAGAKFMLYQQQPSTDYKAYAETEYVTDVNGNIKVDGLPEGNYYFVETTAPDGYVIKMNDDGTAKQYPFTIQAGKAEATVGVDIDLGLIENDTITPGEGGDIDLGSVTIEKSVLNAAGKTITADGTTFYAGVFSKNQDGTYTLVKSATLEQNGKVTIKDLTVGTYYLFETTKQGDRINEADFAFEITGNGQEFQIKSDENTDVKLVNKEKETVESEEETEKESEVETETKTKKTTTVKTGDTTPIALYVGLLAAAAVLIALIVFLRKRKNK